MKPIIKFIACGLIIGIIFFTSCKKENYVPSVVIPPQINLSTSPQDSLTGREFIFNGLVWAYDVDGAGNLYIDVEIHLSFLFIATNQLKFQSNQIHQIHGLQLRNSNIQTLLNMCIVFIQTASFFFIIHTYFPGQQIRIWQEKYLV